MKKIVSRISYILCEEEELRFLSDEFKGVTLDRDALTAKDQRGFTALDWAISNSRHIIAKNLCEAIIDLFAHNEIKARDIIAEALYFLPKAENDRPYKNMIMELNRRHQSKMNEKKGNARRAYPYP